MTTIENCVLVCGECNMRIGDRWYGYEFEILMAEILRRSDDFSEIKTQVRLGSSRDIIDIVAIEKRDGFTKPILFEIKSFTSLTTARLFTIITQLQNYRKPFPQYGIVLVLPGELDEKQVELLKQNGIEIWDQNYLSTRFDKEIRSLKNQKLDSLLQLKKGKTLPLERQYIQQLKKLNPGWDDWSKYQKLVGNILELLFCPPLSKPLIEAYDRSKTNRRDFILPNYARSGNWEYIRNKYSADYIVVDAKNYKTGIRKDPVLQMVNYLKKPGLGMFGIIISRVQGQPVAYHTIKEKWMLDEMMILILTDEDIERMLIEKSNDRDPSHVILQKIEDFRISI